MDAALALIERGGYRAATIEAIASRSGVARTTIYRSWPNRAALVVDLLVGATAGTGSPAPDADPLPALLRELRLVAGASEGTAGRLLIALLGEAESDPDIRKALAEGLFKPRREATARVIRRAQASGLFRRDVPPRLIGDLLYGPLFYRKFIRGEIVSRRFVERIFDCALNGLRPGDPPRAPRAGRGRRDRRRR